MDRRGLLTILRACVQPETAWPPSSGVWAWRPGVLIAPELICPWCERVIKTHNYIWRITQNRVVLGQVQIVHGGRLRLDRPDHPHAGESGYMCLGSAPTALSAFVSISPRNAMYPPTSVRRWIRRVCRHRCYYKTLAVERAARRKKT